MLKMLKNMRWLQDANNTFSRGEGGPAKPGRMRNGDILTIKDTWYDADTFRFLSAFLISLATLDSFPPGEAMVRSTIRMLRFNM